MDQQTIKVTDRLFIEKYNTIHVFDMDGTILDSLHLWTNPVHHWLRLNANHKITLDFIRIIAELNGSFTAMQDAGFFTNYVEKTIGNIRDYFKTLLHREMTIITLITHRELDRLIDYTCDNLQTEVFSMLEKGYNKLLLDKRALEYISYCKHTLKHKCVLATLNNENNLRAIMKSHPLIFDENTGLFDLVVHRELFDDKDQMYDKNKMISYIMEKLDGAPELTILYDDTQEVLDKLPARVGRFKITNIEYDWLRLNRHIKSIDIHSLENKFPLIGLQRMIDIMTKKSSYCQVYTDIDTTTPNYRPSILHDRVVFADYCNFPELQILSTNIKIT